jgi:hypothetical protein
MLFTACWIKTGRKRVSMLFTALITGKINVDAFLSFDKKDREKKKWMKNRTTEVRRKKGHR